MASPPTGPVAVLPRGYPRRRDDRAAPPAAEKRCGEPARVPGVYSDDSAAGIASCNVGSPLARIYP
jgi:hypothetical protein